MFDTAGAATCHGPVTSDLSVFLWPGMERKVLGSHPGQVQVGDGQWMAAQGTLWMIIALGPLSSLPAPCHRGSFVWILVHVPVGW